MEPKLIHSLVAAMMFATSLFNKDKWSKIITGVLSLGIALTWIEDSFFQINGVRLYVLATASVVLYGILNKKLPKPEKIFIIILSMFAFFALLVETLHWAIWNEILLSMVLPLGAYVILMNRGLMKRDEFGFLTLLFMHCLLRVLEGWAY